jgi:uncharacterized OB-fold protein
MTRPLPKATPESKPYWDGLKARRLMLPWCQDCGKAHFYPRIVCPHCGSRRIEWRQASGRGTLYSFVINHRPPAWRSKDPYVIAVVQLDEGPRLMTNLVGVAPDPASIRCDAPVEIQYEDVSDEVTLPLFRPA